MDKTNKNVDGETLDKNTIELRKEEKRIAEIIKLMIRESPESEGIISDFNKRIA